MDDCEYKRIPGFNPPKDSILVENESNYRIGEILVCHSHPKLDHVSDGSIVILVTENAILPERIYKHEDENYFWMEIDNPNEEPKKEIKKTLNEI
ncbi:hypothetical protein [Autumnicola musiva]|uniref:Uncharacterized protein n=1 Tax=Autumnicola musiva TaxID=3075589 RepID=A0ABU3DAC4_9FLAO|nr:hypothetical protein [Zunongwangia sp. F117]MDT0678473.1 hypothetical protein [Zunongwangia sp. F117]